MPIPYPPQYFQPPSDASPPQALQGLQSPYAQQSTVPPQLLAQLLALRGPASAVSQAAEDAANEETRTRSLSAKGDGPMGIRTGEGPNGWAISLGDALGGLAQQFRNKQAKGELSKANANLLSQSQGPLLDMLDVYRGKKPPGVVPQGAPMTSSIPDGGEDLPF